MKILIVIDMQNDFIDGALGTAEAAGIVPYVREKIAAFEGKVFFTRDTHEEDYLSTQEGKNLPVPHCIKGTDGWQIRKELDELRRTEAIDKVTFGSRDLVNVLAGEKDIEEITFMGLCTDICVVSNALILKANFPEKEVYVDAACCAGVTVDTHNAALATMKMCQINVVGEE